MEPSQIRESLLDVFRPFMKKAPDGFVLTDHASLTKDLNIDSADLIDLVMTVEERFSISVGDDRMDQIKTVGDIVSTVAEMTASHQERQP